MASTPEQVREWESVGIYDPAAEYAADRLSLLELLAGLGASIEQMVRANDQFDLTTLPIALQLAANRTLTLADVAAAVGWTDDDVLGFLRVAGLPGPEPGEPWFDERDVELFRGLDVVGELFDEAVSTRLTRVLGASMANLAEAVVAAVIAQVYRLNAATQANEVERAQFNLAAVDALNQSASGIDTVLGLHLRAAVERWILAEGDPLTGTLRLAVGFVDLVGYTPRSLHATPDEIRGMVEELEATAYEVAADHQGRVVKLIGDAVMYVSTTPSHACAIALAFVEAFRSHAGDITPRGGVAMGDVVAWQGDYYGPVVNLSARIAELAVPNEVLVAAPVPTETAPVSGITFVPAGRRLLKGCDEPVELWAAQRA